MPSLGKTSLLVLRSASSFGGRHFSALVLAPVGASGAKALSGLSQLTALHLGFNHIGDAGAKAVASLRRLRTLSLWDNGIGDVGAKALANLAQLTLLNLGKFPGLAIVHKWQTLVGF